MSTYILFYGYSYKFRFTGNGYWKTVGKGSKEENMSTRYLCNTVLWVTPLKHTGTYTETDASTSVMLIGLTKTEACLKVSQVQSNQNRVSLGHDYAYQQTFMECLLCVIPLPLIYLLLLLVGFPDSSVGKESTCSPGDLSSISGLGRSSVEGKGYPLQYSGLENSLSWTRLSDFKLNIQKTKIMASGPITSWEIDGETVETVSHFIFGGSKITADGDCSHEIKDAYSLEGKLWPT